MVLPEIECIYYVRTWLSFLQKTLEQQAPESAQKNINLEYFRIKSSISTLRSNEAFSFAVKSLEKLKLKANEKTKRLNHLFASLSTKL